jgi:hypothetical protein
VWLTVWCCNHAGWMQPCSPPNTAAGVRGSMVILRMLWPCPHPHYCANRQHDVQRHNIVLAWLCTLCADIHQDICRVSWLVPWSVSMRSYADNLYLTTWQLDNLTTFLYLSTASWAHGPAPFPHRSMKMIKPSYTKKTAWTPGVRIISFVCLYRFACLYRSVLG